MRIPLPKLMKLKRRETVVFAWITFKSRAHRNRVNAAVMKDPRMSRMAKAKPVTHYVNRRVPRAQSAVASAGE